MSDEIAVLAKLAIRQAQIINLLALQLADQACLLVPHLQRCGKCNVEPVTVEHVHTKVRLCDRCWAELIVNSSRAYINSYVQDPNDPLNDVRTSSTNENDWVNLPDADKIRRMIDYVKIIKESEITQDRMH